MTRITTHGRDTWSQPGNLTRAQSDRAYRYEPTALAKLRELYAADREPLWKSVVAVAILGACVVAMVWL